MKIPGFSKPEDKTKFSGTSSEQRESALASIAQRLGAAEGWKESSQNAFTHHSLPGHTSYARAFETRMHTLLTPVTVIIREWVCKCDLQPCDKNDCKKKAEKIANKTMILRDKKGELRTLFHDTMTLTEWIKNYYQESPSVNARGRTDQVELAKAGYAVPAIMGMQPYATEPVTE
jgi:hypothetical protein